MIPSKRSINIVHTQIRWWRNRRLWHPGPHHVNLLLIIFWWERISSFNLPPECFFYINYIWTWRDRDWQPEAVKNSMYCLHSDFHDTHIAITLCENIHFRGIDYKWSQNFLLYYHIYNIKLFFFGIFHLHVYFFIV